MTRLLADENIRGHYISYLRQLRPHADLITAQEVGLRRKDDRLILEWAANNNRVVVSSDRKTMIRFASNRIKAGQVMNGLIFIKQVLPVQLVANDLLMILEVSEMDEWKNQIRFIPL